MTVRGQTFLLSVPLAPKLPYGVILGLDLPTLLDLVRDQKAISQNGTEDHQEVQSLRQEVESQRQKVECRRQEGESLSHPSDQQAYTGPQLQFSIWSPPELRRQGTPLNSCHFGIWSWR